MGSARRHRKKRSMAARKHLWHPDEVRKKIQASQLINRLTAHANAAAPLMDASQVNAAKILLSKAIPDLSSVTIAGDQDNPLKHKHDMTVRFVSAKGE